MHLRRFVAALALGASLLAVPAASPAPTAGVGPLPACRLDDILTSPRDYDSGPTTLVDYILRLGKGYKPPDLVSVRDAGVRGGGFVRRIALADLRAMGAAAEANGTPLVAWSPYRGYRQQKSLFRGYANTYGFDEAIKFSARPGHSEHQLGLTIDFVAVGDKGLTSNWQVTPTGGWMEKNAWKYGWLMSYPKGKKSVTCYRFEPWHYRWFGRELAAAIHESGLTTREYLWANFTTVDPGTGEPGPTPSVSPSGSPIPSASADASPATSTSPTAGPVAEPSMTDGPPATASPVATIPPSPVEAPIFGIDLPVTAGLLLVVVSIGLVVSLRLLRRSHRR